MAVAARKPGNEVPDSNRSLFRGEKIANRTQSPGSSLFIFFPLGLENQSTHTCTSNEKQLYLLKNPNPLQEGPVSNLQSRCVRADEGRERVRVVC